MVVDLTNGEWDFREPEIPFGIVAAIVQAQEAAKPSSHDDTDYEDYLTEMLAGIPGPDDLTETVWTLPGERSEHARRLLDEWNSNGDLVSAVNFARTVYGLDEMPRAAVIANKPRFVQSAVDYYFQANDEHLREKGIAYLRELSVCEPNGGSVSNVIDYARRLVFESMSRTPSYFRQIRGVVDSLLESSCFELVYQVSQVTE